MNKTIKNCAICKIDITKRTKYNITGSFVCDKCYFKAQKITHKRWDRLNKLKNKRLSKVK